MDGVRNYGGKITRNLTALLQHLQRLVGQERYRYWCGGVIAPEKLERFARKMVGRYPLLLRTERGRTYDRSKGRAAIRLVVYPRQGEVLWWLVSTEGTGGLADPGCLDANVVKNAESAQGHITVLDYVLMYATKQEPHQVPDKRRRSGKRTALRKLSTWTWKMRSEVFNEVRAAIDAHVKARSYGDEPRGGGGGWGLRGELWRQRQRPLFSGVRNQVIALHRYAEDEWGTVRSEWRGRHPQLVARYGERAGALMSVSMVMEQYLPLMVLQPVWGEHPMTLGDLWANPGGHGSAEDADGLKEAVAV